MSLIHGMSITDQAAAANVGAEHRLPTSSSTSITIDRRLTAAASRRIEEIVLKRSLKAGDVMAELGFSKLNASVGMALARGTQLRPDVIAALEKWISTNASV